MPSSKRPSVSAELAAAVAELHAALADHYGELSAEAREALTEAINKLSGDSGQVAAPVAAAIGRVDALLRADWGYAFQYHITVAGKTVAAANTTKCADLEGHTIKPKTRRKH